MSLLFDHALSHFDPERGDQYEIVSDDLDSSGSHIPVRPIVKFARQHDLEFPGNDEYVPIPLHGKDDAMPTGDYLGYSETDLPELRRECPSLKERVLRASREGMNRRTVVQTIKRTHL